MITLSNLGHKGQKSRSVRIFFDRPTLRQKHDVASLEMIHNDPNIFQKIYRIIYKVIFHSSDPLYNLYKDLLRKLHFKYCWVGCKVSILKMAQNGFAQGGSPLICY